MSSILSFDIIQLLRDEAKSENINEFSFACNLCRITSSIDEVIFAMTLYNRHFKLRFSSTQVVMLVLNARDMVQKEKEKKVEYPFN